MSRLLLVHRLACHLLCGLVHCRRRDPFLEGVSMSNRWLVTARICEMVDFLGWKLAMDIHH